MRAIHSTSLWKNTIFVQVFSAYSLLMFGVFLDMLAIMTIVSFQWEVDPIMVGLIPAAYALPGILFSSWAGVIADRFKKIPIMILCNLAVGLLTIVLLFVRDIHWLLLVLTIRSTFSIFHYPAQQTLTRQIVSPTLLMKAVSINGIVEQGTKIVGPLIGGILLSWFQPELCLIIKAVCCLLATFVLLSAIKLEERVSTEHSEKKQSNTWTDWLQGWGYVWSNRIIGSTIIFVLIAMAVLQLVDSQFPTLFKSLFPHDKSKMGYMISVIGSGGILGGLFIQKLKQGQYGWALYGGVALMGIGFGIIGLINSNTPIVFAYLICLVAGFGSGLMIIANQVILQNQTHEEQVGRVFGIQSSLTNAIFIISPAMSGPLVHLFGVTKLYVYVGMGLIVVGGMGFLLQKYFWGKPTKIQNKVTFASEHVSS
ncbi:MFS family permease [Croceifilum oryzae]|uniref:MFS family permease n=1 Tax=Croceifilum oryzae TaxID=1553429 RepID=A0AAJ1TQD3_9BACL|nr:MFS transporter [Croceifilum oryzae]MDQ0418591.1 MFS family permease [Croceifilum oryzae]